MLGVGLVWDLLLNETCSEMPTRAGSEAVGLMGHDGAAWGWEQPDLPRVLQGAAIPAVRLPAPPALISCPPEQGLSSPSSPQQRDICVYYEKLSAKLFRVVLYCKG